MTISKNEVMQIYPAINLHIEEPRPDPKAAQRTVKSIANAWKHGTIVDAKGWMWVSKDKLHTILRTNTVNARHLIKGMKDEYIMVQSGKKYIRGYKVLELLGKQMEENGVGTKGTYLESSKDYYDAINKCDKVKYLRLEYDVTLSAQRKKLKNKRKKKYGLKQDELTGDPLGRGTEFSHIRSVAIYKHLSDTIENGLVVNKSTHEIITAQGINDEVELLALCEEMGWRTDWHPAYIKKQLWV